MSAMNARSPSLGAILRGLGMAVSGPGLFDTYARDALHRVEGTAVVVIRYRHLLMA